MSDSEKSNCSSDEFHLLEAAELGIEPHTERTLSRRKAVFVSVECSFLLCMATATGKIWCVAPLSVVVVTR